MLFCDYASAVARLKQHHLILISMAVAAALGLGLRAAADAGFIGAEVPERAALVGREIGDVFLTLLKMLVVPLIVSSLITGVTGLGNLRELGALGARTIAYFIGTSMLAITVGLFWVNVFTPGVGVDPIALSEMTGDHAFEAPEDTGGVFQVLWEQLKGMVPDNPIGAAATSTMLPTIFFSIMLGVFISMVEHDERREEKVRESVALVRRFFEGLFAVMMEITLKVIALAPIGVFGFVLFAAAAHGLPVFVALFDYAKTVALALATHALVVLPLILFFVGKRRPRAYAGAMMPALLTAFSTASSNGTLPLTMERASENGGVSRPVVSFVLPLGATINMDGTALYEVVAVLFIAQVYGIDLGLGQQVVVALTALMASVGAAGIPHAGAVMMVVVLTAVGLPVEGVGLIMAVDRILDMARTGVNVWSDSIACAVVDRFTATPPEPCEPEARAT
jgi:proton glutamate symport protein